LCLGTLIRITRGYQGKEKEAKHRGWENQERHPAGKPRGARGKGRKRLEQRRCRKGNEWAGQKKRVDQGKLTTFGEYLNFREGKKGSNGNPGQ